MRLIPILLIALTLCSCQPSTTSNLKRQTSNHKPQNIKSHTFKKLPVLEYHKIGYPEGRWTRTPENFQSDLEWLYENGYYPFNFRDILSTFEALPEGKTPVIITFDDSTSSQFRYLKNGKLDPQCAVGILKSFHEKHPDWPLRATFFVVIETNDKDRNLFGQPENPNYQARKLRQLEEWGMEVGSHTYCHDRLSNVSLEQARHQLARASKMLEKNTGRKPVSLALPMGLYPKDLSVLSGKYQRTEYDFKLAAEVAGGLQPAPWEKGFDPLHIKRIQTIKEEWKKFFGRYRSKRLK